MNKEEIVQRLEELKQEKKQLKKQLKELPSLEVGKWYKDPTQLGYIYFITEVLNDRIKGYGFFDGEWENDIELLIFSVIDDTPATRKEVETALIKEAKKRYKKGYTIKPFNIHLMIDEPKKTMISSDNFNISSYESELGIWVESVDWNSVVFHKGKWAEIIEEPKTVTLNGDFTENNLKDIINNRF